MKALANSYRCYKIEVQCLCQHIINLININSLTYCLHYSSFNCKEAALIVQKYTSFKKLRNSFCLANTIIRCQLMHVETQNRYLQKSAIVGTLLLYIRATHTNNEQSDQALHLRCLLGHVTGWFEIKNLALEANQAMRQGGLLYKGGLQGKMSNLCKTSF